QLTSAQVDALIGAELLDPDTAYLARRGPVPLDVGRGVIDALDAAGAPLDGEQTFYLGYGSEGLEYLRVDGAYVGYRCPDGSEAWLYPPPAGVGDASAASTTTTTAAPTTPSTPTTTTTDAVAPTTTTTVPLLGTTTIPPGADQVLSADLAEGQRAWAVYVRALSIEGGPVQGHGRAGLWEDYKFESMAVLEAAGYAPEIVLLPCDGPEAVATVLPVLPDGPADASPESVSAMGAYFVDEAAARRAADRLGDEVLAIAPVVATCVDVDGPGGTRR
ncbi:MAG: hypothetical protein KDB04_13005, partial [Acidimicrobiales bacterium]|nr:hypothetical protein [Acidimicrobiales bacterium]